MKDKAEIFKVLSEPNRIRILMMLLQKPLCVCEITSVIGLTTATVSSHLSYLRRVGFVEDEKNGKWINYRISTKISNPMIKGILESLPKWYSNEIDIQNDLQKVSIVDRYEISMSLK